MSFVKSFSNLVFQRSFSVRSLHPKKFVSILENVPTKPRNPWQIYLRENIKNYKNEAGKVDLKLATQTLGPKWKALPEAEKEKFVKTYNAELEAHNTKFEEALKNATPKQFKEENELRKKYKLDIVKDPRRPKRPMNSFMFYLEHLRATNDPIMQDIDVRAQVTAAAIKFKELDPSVAKPFLQKGHDASAEYQKAIREYNESAAPYM